MRNLISREMPITSEEKFRIDGNTIFIGCLKIFQEIQMVSLEKHD